jgi:hypothetical protein
MRLFSLFLVAIFLNSCSSLLENPADEGQQVEKDFGSIAFSMSLAEATTQLGVPIDSVCVRLQGPVVVNGKLTISGDSTSASGTFQSLTKGTYSISVAVFSGADTIAAGTGSAVINPGKQTTASISLAMRPGKLVINVSWGDQVIVFVNTISAINQICTIRSDGSNLQTLTSFSSNHSMGKPSYSPNGAKIAFWLDSIGMNVWIMNSDGSNLHKLTSNNEAFIGDRIEFSPNSDTIYYRRTTVAGAASIWRIGVDGSNNGLYFDFPGNEYMIKFVGSSYLLFYVHGGGLYKTTSLSNLSSSLLISGGQQPAANYNLSKLAYQDYGSGNGKLKVANIDASSPLLLVDEGTNFIDTPSFTPDGRAVVYSINSSVKIVNIDGTGLRTITTGSDPMVRPN